MCMWLSPAPHREAVLVSKPMFRCLQMNEEAQRLANHAFGAPLLHVMGYMYDRKAEPWLGNIVGEWFARKYHNAGTMVRIIEGFAS